MVVLVVRLNIQAHVPCLKFPAFLLNVIGCIDLHVGIPAVSIDPESVFTRDA